MNVVEDNDDDDQSTLTVYDRTFFYDGDGNINYRYGVRSSVLDRFMSKAEVWYRHCQAPRLRRNHCRFIELTLLVLGLKRSNGRPVLDYNKDPWQSLPVRLVHIKIEVYARHIN
jgi:hypothetical protein